MKRRFLVLAGLLLLAPVLTVAADRAPLVSYGPAAKDDVVRQVLFIVVPAKATQPMYLRLLDADCGGDLDSRTGEWDTRTRFALYGGAGATTGASLKDRAPSEADLRTGALIAERVFSVDAESNNKWSVFTKLDPAAGDTLGDTAVFKLVVEGLAGDDGNVFDVAVSLNETKNVLPEGVRVLSYAPRVRNPAPGIVGELRFAPPGADSELTVSSYDLAGARFGLTTALQDVTLASSGQSVWLDGKVAAPAARIAALVFEGGEETPNDASFSISGSEGPIPFELPVLLWKRNRRPVATIRTAAVSDCLSVAFEGTASDEDGEALTFAWSFGDGESGEGPRLTHSYEKPGTYDAQLVVTDASGQVANASAQRVRVVVNDPPRAKAGTDLIGAPLTPLVFDATGTTDSDGAIARYLWDFGDGSRGEGARPSHAYAKAGSYRVRLRVEDDSKAACGSGEAAINVRINIPPVAVPGDNRSASAAEELSLDGGRSFDEDGTITEWRWNFGDGASGEGRTPTHAYKEPGTYRVKLTVKDNAGAPNSSGSAELVVVVNQPPTPQAGPPRRVAVGEVIPFDASASTDPDGRVVGWEWDFGNGARAEGVRVEYAYKEAKTYTVTLSVRDDSGLSSGTRTTSTKVVVNEAPKARAGGNRVITASEVRFDGKASSDSDGTITRYVWDFGDGTRGEGPAPVHVYRRAGTYRVRLTVTDDSQTRNAESSDEAVVVVNQVPIADAGPDKLGAPQQVLSFSAAESLDPDGEIISYAWEFGDGSTASGQTATHAFAAPGLYTVRLTVRDDSGHETGIAFDEGLVRVNAQPVAVAGPRVLVAPGDPVELNGSSSQDSDGKIVSYQWTFSDGVGAASSAKVSRKFDRPGIYTAELAVTDDSGAINAMAAERVTIRVNSGPRARAGEDVVTCISTVTVNAGGSADPDGDPLTYSWNFGDGSPAQAGALATHTYALGGSYPVVLTTDDGSGLKNARSTSGLTVVINRPPSADAGGEKTACAGKPAIFSGNRSQDPEGGLLKYLWDFGDGGKAEAPNPTKTFSKGGSYQTTLTVTDDSGLTCSTGIDRIAVRVAEAPVADAGADQKVCANSEVRFDGSKSRDFDGLVNGYAWDFGDGSTGGGPTPTHTYTQPGTYRATLIVTGDEIGSCDNTDAKTATITVYAAPIARFKTPRVVSLGASTSFDGSPSSPEGARFVSWKWDFGDGHFAEGERVSHAYTKPGNYFATLTVQTDSGTACASTTARNLITVNDPPVALADAVGGAGVNQEMSFDASRSKDPDGSIVSYAWDFGDGQTALGALVRHRYQKPGTYNARLTVTDDSGVPNGAATANVPVVVNQAPTPVIAASGQGCPGEEVRFESTGSLDADGEIKLFQWDFGDGQAAQGAQVSHTFRAPGKYEVSLTAEDNAGVTNSRNKTTRTFVVNERPVALGGPDQVVCAMVPARFDGSRSTDRDGKLLGFRWDFGDGTQGDGAISSHTYATPGRFEAVLKLTDDSGAVCGVAEDSVRVKVNSPPVAQAGPDREALLGGAHDAVAFDATGSLDPDQDPLTFLWDFGDGVTDSGAKVAHAYAKPGRYVVKLRVRDGSGTGCGEVWDEAIVDVKERR